MEIKTIDETDRILAVVLHLSGFFSGFIIPFIIPLVIWLLKKEESSFIDQHGKAVINFQITTFAFVVIACFFILFTIGIGALIVIPLALVFAGIYIVCMIVGAVKAFNGHFFQYPFTYTFIK